MLLLKETVPVFLLKTVCMNKVKYICFFLYLFLCEIVKTKQTNKNPKQLLLPVWGVGGWVSRFPRIYLACYIVYFCRKMTARLSYRHLYTFHRCLFGSQLQSEPESSGFAGTFQSSGPHPRSQTDLSSVKKVTAMAAALSLPRRAGKPKGCLLLLHIL